MWAQATGHGTWLWVEAPQWMQAPPWPCTSRPAAASEHMVPESASSTSQLTGTPDRQTESRSDHREDAWQARTTVEARTVAVYV